MKLTLKRTAFEADGIFGHINDEHGSLLCVTLEHAYDSGLGNGTFAPKTPNGTYKCVRGMHRLPSMATPFETFEITHVPGHSNILFHVGNYNKDSEGCVLLGDTRSKNMIYHSKVTFAKFMDLLKNVNDFTLTIEG